MDGNSSVLKSYLIHRTLTSEVRAQVINIDNTSYIGLERKYYPTEHCPEKSKGIYLPVQAWETFVKETLPLLRINKNQEQVPLATRTKKINGMLQTFIS